MIVIAKRPRPLPAAPRVAAVPAAAGLAVALLAAAGLGAGVSAAPAESAALAAQPAAQPAAVAAEPASILVKDVGLRTPESVLHDREADVYLVSNINGSPLQKDGNGFLSRVAPDGKVVALQWIAGGTGKVVLDAPKGMGIKGEVLLVADIDVVRRFDRKTGAPLEPWPVPGATFLNDIAVAADGTVYVSDMGFKAADGGMAPSGTDAIYRFDDQGRPSALIRGPELGGPNGLLPLAGGGVLVATFGGGALYAVDEKGARSEWPKPEGGQLDGIVRDGAGTIWITSWEKAAVYAVKVEEGAKAGPTVHAAIQGVTSPADLGIDLKRGRLLIPLFMLDQLDIRPLPR